MRSSAAFRYLPNVSSLVFHEDHCRSCGACLEVCPRQVFAWAEGAEDQDPSRRVVVADRDACIECGACARNCPHRALSLRPGAGCASLILQQWLADCGWKGKKPKTGCC